MNTIFLDSIHCVCVIMCEIVPLFLFCGITYYNENGIMKKAISYEYPNDARIIISQINSKGKVIERRIIPKKELK